MPQIDGYAPGTFCWAELGTPDPVGATRFYTTLFGWAVDDRPGGADVTYTLLTLAGQAVAALYREEPAHRPESSQWLSYVSVAGARESADRARTLGGTVLLEPFDVLDVGWMALVQDPVGGVVALWEPRSHAGAGLIGEPGAMTWNELATPAAAAAIRFYGDLFGWSATAADRLDGRAILRADGAPRASVAALDPAVGAGPARWLVYFAVDDCDGRAALAQSLGGSIREPPTRVSGLGRVAIVADPLGARFGLVAMESAATGRGG